MKTAILFLFALIPGWAQVSTLTLGTMLDSSGALRPVRGVIASATVGDPILTDSNAPFLSFACSAALCLAKTESAVVDPSGKSPDAPAPQGPAWIAISGTSAFVFFPASQQLAVWNNGQLTPIAFASGGEVLSLRATDGGFDYAVRRDDGVWIERYLIGDGSSTALGSLSDAHDPSDLVMLVSDATLIAGQNHVSIVRADGTKSSFLLAGATQFLQMSGSYVEIVTGGSSGTAGARVPNESAMWVLRIDPGHEQLAMLPGAPPRVLRGLPRRIALPAPRRPSVRATGEAQ